jgi:hypothetical protein
MSTSAAFPRVNGNSVVPAEDQREANFLRSLLQVRDEVFAGKHLRIRLPAKVLEQVAPRLSQIAPPAKPTTNGTSNEGSSSQPFTSRLESSLQHFPSSNESASAGAYGSRPFSAKSASSGIDPVLLTKSDHLIRAELQLKRQQLERVLKDQLDKRGRANDDDREVLDVESLLAEAQRLVKPVSGLRISDANSDAAESFDENSYYSSKADSWSSEEVDRNQNNNADAAEPLTLQGKHIAIGAKLTEPKSNQARHLEPTVIELDEEPYEPADDIEIYEPGLAGVHEEADESDYSPPPADAGPIDPRRGRGREDHGAVNGYGVDASFCLNHSLYSLVLSITWSAHRHDHTIVSRRQDSNHFCHQCSWFLSWLDSAATFEMLILHTGCSGAKVPWVRPHRSRTTGNANARISVTRDDANWQPNGLSARPNLISRKNPNRPLLLLPSQTHRPASGAQCNPVLMMWKCFLCETVVPYSPFTMKDRILLPSRLANTKSQ